MLIGFVDLWDFYVGTLHLFAITVFLSRNMSLDKIWQLVGNKEKFITYVQAEVQTFLNPTEEE